MYYCGLHKNGNKICNEREYAIQNCKDPWLKKYYETEDLYWLHECWKQIDKSMLMQDWDELKSETYLYFVDRAERFSILHRPAALMACYAKGLKLKQWQELSPEITWSAFVGTDESLRNWSGRGD